MFGLASWQLPPCHAKVNGRDESQLIEIEKDSNVDVVLEQVYPELVPYEETGEGKETEC